jgi:hypothetical protein
MPFREIDLKIGIDRARTIHHEWLRSKATKKALKPDLGGFNDP